MICKIKEEKETSAFLVMSSKEVSKPHTDLKDIGYIRKPGSLIKTILDHHLIVQEKPLHQ